MHELALAQGIVELVADQSRRDGFVRAKVVHLELGALSAVMPEALLFGFDSASAGTPAEGARLEIARLPGKAWCMDCAADVEVPSRIAPCPTCGGPRLVVTSGEQLRVTELEVV